MSDSLPTIQHVTNNKEVLSGKEVILFCASKGRSDSINLFKQDNTHYYQLAKGKGFIKKSIKATETSSYMCEIESSGIRAKEDFKISVVRKLS